MASWKPSLDGQRDGLLPVIVYILGILSCLSLVFKTSAFLLLYLKPSKLRRYLHHDASGRPAWALVTGASDGIGKHFCHELAAHGFNVVLHGRNPAKLAAVQDDLATRFPARKFRLLIADASAIPCNSCRDQDRDDPASEPAGGETKTASPPVADFDGIAASLADINLTVLINNAGGTSGTPVYQFLQDAPEARLIDTVNLNAVFPLILQARLLPHLLRSGPALILNIGSLSDNGLPMLASYASSKVFMGVLSRIIPHELILQDRGGDVEVLAVRVGETTGTSALRSAPSLWVPDAGTMARAVLARVGCGRAGVVGYFPHALQQVLGGVAPGFVRDRVFRGVIRTRWVEEREGRGDKRE